MWLVRFSIFRLECDVESSWLKQTSGANDEREAITFVRPYSQGYQRPRESQPRHRVELRAVLYREADARCQFETSRHGARCRFLFALGSSWPKVGPTATNVAR